MTWKEIASGVASNLIAAFAQKLIENNIDLTSKHKTVVIMVAFLPTIALVFWGIALIIKRYVDKNEANHFLSDLLREYNFDHDEMVATLQVSGREAFQNMGSFIIRDNETIQREQEQAIQNRFFRITQIVAEKYGDRIPYSEIKKLIKKRLE